MNKTITLLLGIFLLTSCGSQRYLQKAQFDQAINVAVKKIRKKPTKVEEIDNLKYAYTKANQIDKDRLSYLFESQTDDIWDEVHQRYNKLYYRQELVKTLPDDILTQIGYTEENYAQKITQSKQNAAEYHYNKGVNLLVSKNKYDARDAYSNFVKARSFYPHYKDVNQKITEAKFIGTNHILFKIANESKIMLPEDFEKEMLKISLDELNQQWIDYDTRASENIPYDFYIQLSIKQITVSPNNVSNNSFKEEKEIEDGFKYQLDAKGNVQKDTLGNDVKLPIYKIINCTVRETLQHKEALIGGTIDYINTVTNQLVKTHPVTATMVFDYHSAEAFGDINALKEESKKKIGGEPIAFPADPQMIMDAVSMLKENTKTIIYSNKDWLKQ